MRLSRFWWAALSVAIIFVAGCAGERSVTPASPYNAASKRAPARLKGAAAPCTVPASSAPLWQRTFGYTGSPVSWQVPSGVTQLIVVAQGAQGGGYGLGGCARAMVPVRPGENLSVVVGGQGSANETGGYNGGGNGGAQCCYGSPGGGGGGASDVRQGGAGLQNRIVVAGGGGGSSGNGWWGGTGGGKTGGNGYQSTDYSRGAGGGGTQTAGGQAATGGTGGTLGSGGKGGTKSTSGRFGGGGGGGGYYGGGGGRYSHHDDATNLDDGDSGGGGGSGYTESNATEVYSANGVHYGNGQVTVAWPQAQATFASGLTRPLGISVDTNNNVYVTTYSHVYKYSPSGSRTTISKFNQPIAVAADANGNVFVSDLYDQAIYEIGNDGASKTSVVNGVKADGLGVDGDGNLYFTDRCGENCGVLDVLSGRTVTKLATIYNPESLAVDATCKASCPIFVTENYDGFFGREYFYFDLFDSTGFKTRIDLSFPSPTAVAVDAAGSAYVVDGPLKAVGKYTFGATPFNLGSNWGYPTETAVNPKCSSVCPVFVTDYQNGLIVEVH